MSVYRIARAALHYWEEPCISGERGSGTIFFSGCTLRCVYCQNRRVSSGELGREMSSSGLIDTMLKLQEDGAENINLVTPDLYLGRLQQDLPAARKAGLNIPLLFNISGWEAAGSLARFEGIADIWLTDFKYWDEETAWRYSRAKNYRSVAQAALAEMVRQQPEPVFDQRGMMQRGVIVRHLLLPGKRKDAMRIVRYLYETYGDRIWLSLMSQYTPFDIPAEFPELSRTVTRREYERLLAEVTDLGIGNCFIQERGSIGESFIPEFS